jgi:hypothetical protein
MPVKIGSTSIGAVKVGSTNIARIYSGSTLVADFSAAPFDPEATLGTPDLTQAPANFDMTPPANSGLPMVLAMDVTFPSTTPNGSQIFEQGGGGRGIMINCRDGYLRFRFGDGGGAIASGFTTAGIDSTGGNTFCVDLDYQTNFIADDAQHTLVWEVDPRSGQLKSRIWLDGVNLLDWSSTSSVESNQWGGGASGTFLGAAGTNIAGETTFDSVWPDTKGELRVYLNTGVP